MIYVEKEAYQVIKDILKKYPLTIYAYGSRTKQGHKKFSDLDLCVFDDTYKKLDIFNLQEDLKESNLPFTVDVVPWSMMDEDFKNLIIADLVLIQSNPAFIQAIEVLLSRYFYLAEKLGFKVFEQSNFLMIDCPGDNPIFNMLYQKAIPEMISFKKEIKKATEYYKGRSFWLIFKPDFESNSVAPFLLQNGFYKELSGYFTILQLQLEGLKMFEILESVTIKNVATLNELSDFVLISSEYKGKENIFKVSYEFIEAKFIERHPLFVIYMGEKPVGIASIYISDEDNVGVYDVVTIKEYRSQGIATNMMKYLINYCLKKGLKKIYLATSSNSGYRIYKRLGFNLIGKVEYYEWN